MLKIQSKLCIPLLTYVHSLIWFPTSCGTHWCMPISKSGWNVHASGCSKVTANFDKLIYTHSPKHTHTHTHSHAAKLDNLSCQIKCSIDTHIMQNTDNNNNKRNWINKVKTSTSADNFSYSAWIVTPFSLFSFFFFFAAGGNQATKLTSFPQKDKANGRRRRREGGTEWHERKALAMLSFPFLSVSAVNFGQHLKQMRWWAKV